MTNQNIQFNIEEKPEPKKKGRKVKYATDEERKKAKREQTLASNKKKKEAIKKAKEEGSGIFSGINKLVNKVAHKVGKTIKKTEDYGKAIVYGRSDYPPKVRSILEKYKNEIVVEMTIKRTPVPSLLTGALNAVSLGSFNKNMDNTPYDKLFHLYLDMKTQSGVHIVVEKNEVINMEVNEKERPQTETKLISSIPQNLTIEHIINNTKHFMGDNFFKYSARDNNCQDFILAILKSNNIGSQEDMDFVKQNTKQLFEGLTGLRKFSNTITDIGAKANVALNGAGMNKPKQYLNETQKIKESDDDSSDGDSMDGEGINGSSIVQSVVFESKRYNITQSKKWLKENGYKSPKVDKETNTIRFRQIDPKKVGKMGFTKYKNKKLGNSGITLILVYKDVNKNKISTNYISMPKFEKGSKEAKEYMASIRAKRGGAIIAGRPIGIQEPFGRDKRTWTPISNVVKSTGSGVIEDAIGGARHLLGFGAGGVHIHHHHYHPVDGTGMWDWADPKKNGVEKAFTQDLPSVLIHKALPAVVSSATGALVGAATENPVLGFAAGQTIGKVAGNKAGDALGNATGYGFKKGSKEAREHMAKLRAMRKN